MINLSSISGHQFFPPAIFLTPLAPCSKISVSSWKSIPVHIPGKKSPSLIKRTHVLWGLNVYIRSFIEKVGFSGFMSQLKSKSICPATPNKPAACAFCQLPMDAGYSESPACPGLSQPILGSPSLSWALPPLVVNSGLLHSSLPQPQPHP